MRFFSWIFRQVIGEIKTCDQFHQHFNSTFAPIFLCHKISNLKCKLKEALHDTFVHKMLVKLRPGESYISTFHSSHPVCCPTKLFSGQLRLKNKDQQFNGSLRHFMVRFLAGAPSSEVYRASIEQEVGRELTSAARECSWPNECSIKALSNLTCERSQKKTNKRISERQKLRKPRVNHWLSTVKASSKAGMNNSGTIFLQAQGQRTHSCYVLRK